MYYREDKRGRILQEGINEAGAISSWISAGTAYSTHGINMIPFYIFYSMFGFQRVGDLAWAAGDIQARGFLVGGTAGRTTLAGEGLQHDDGHSHLFSANIPNCISYDPTYAYELAVIVRDGMRRMFEEQENVFYYLTVMNENYRHPPMPDGAEEGILRGMYLVRDSGARSGSESAPRVQLLGSGTILREVLAAAELLEKDYGRGRRRVERDLVHRAAARRDARGALEPPAPVAGAPRELRGPLPPGAARAGGRGQRLRQALRRPDPSLRAAHLPLARHRRLRAQRHPGEPAPLFSRSTATSSP